MSITPVSSVPFLLDDCAGVRKRLKMIRWSTEQCLGCECFRMGIRNFADKAVS